MTTIAIDTLSQSSATNDAPLTASFARQPILNRDGMLCGYEIKVRAPELPLTPPDEAGNAAPQSGTQTPADPADADVLPGRQPTPAERVARAIVHGLVQADVRGAVTGHPTYIDVSRDLLLDDAILRLPAERFMLELPSSLEVDDGLIARLVYLHGRRYRFVLDNVTQPTETFAKLLPYAEVVKIDITRAPRALLPKLASVLKSAGKLLLA
ncbi:MAG TPA: diguanylate phosphodiesterase, partial [Paraburkholderia sp.]|nr:diguanylate phosphodiesterase [Paraburkholderia sp.]